MLIDLANTVLAALRSKTWALPVEPVRLTDPRFTLEELATLRVSVSERLWDTVALTRADRRNEVTIAVNLMQHIVPRDHESRQDQIDRLTALAEEIVGHFRPPGYFEGRPQYKLVSVKLANTEPRLVKDLAEADVFNSSIALGFQIV